MLMINMYFLNSENAAGFLSSYDTQRVKFLQFYIIVIP